MRVLFFVKPLLLGCQYLHSIQGIGNYVIDGMNGYKLTMDADANAFATKIKEAIETNELLKLREGCLNFYEEKLNWKAWANNFKKLMNDAML